MPQIEGLMEFPQDYFGSAADRSQLAARRLVLRDARKEVRPPQASALPYHPYAHEPWRSGSSSRLHATNQQQQQQQQTGNVGASPAQTYRRILLLGPSPPTNASDHRLVSSLQNRNNNYYASSQYLPSRGGGGCEINDRVGREAPPQSFRRGAVGRDDDRERVTVNFLAAMANRKELMLPRAKETDESDESKQYAGLDVSLHL